jgi:hypothetical protein
MNILFSSKNINIFDDIEIKELARNFEILEKFKVRALKYYFEQNMYKIEKNLTSLDINNHFKLLYTASKSGNFNVINKHPLMISFLLKIKEGEMTKELKKDTIKLAWILMYYSKLELAMNPITDNALIKLIQFLKEDNSWICNENVELILEIIMMIDFMKSVNIRINNGVEKYFDKENILNLMNYHFLNFNDVRNQQKILKILEGQKIFEFKANKNTNVFYIDFVLKYFEKVN